MDKALNPALDCGIDPNLAETTCHSYNLASIKQAFLAGYNYAQDLVEISEWDGWHRIAPSLVWPSWSEVEKAANEYNQPRA